MDNECKRCMRMMSEINRINIILKFKLGSYFLKKRFQMGKT